MTKDRDSENAGLGLQAEMTEMHGGLRQDPSSGGELASEAAAHLRPSAPRVGEALWRDWQSKAMFHPEESVQKKTKKI